MVNSTGNTLSIVPVDAPNSPCRCRSAARHPTPVGVSAREGIALVPLGLDNAVAVVDLRAATLMRTIPLPDNSGATGSTIVDDSIGYVGNPEPQHRVPGELPHRRHIGGAGRRLSRKA